MSSPRARALPPVQRRPRVRKSIASTPSSELGQENATIDVASLAKSSAATKISRSKSLGPGGLDALKETSGNRRRSAASSFQPKSILKPTIPLSPIRAIPTRRSENNDEINSEALSSPPRPGSTEKVPDTPGRSAEINATSAEGTQPQEEKADDEPTEDAYALEQRKRKAEIQKQRAARRESMAGRRVSFAPEATLHTWDTEILQDSTISTGSLDSTRRASSYLRSSRSNESRPSTPPMQVEEDTAKKSPEHQRDAHKKRRRRSSGIPPMNFNDPDALSSSPFSSSSVAEDGDNIVNEANGIPIGSPSPRKDMDATLGEATMKSIAEPLPREEGELDASLEDAAMRAGTKILDFDENGDVSMDIASDEVTAAFKPWVKQSMGAGSPHPRKTLPKRNQENVHFFSPGQAADRGSPTASYASAEDMSMDMTQAMGGIMRAAPTTITSNAEDMSMDMTQAMGSIVRDALTTSSASAEDMSMDMTQAMGGIMKNAPATISSSGERYPKRRKTTNTDAHLLSKATWYEQRMKLLEDIRESLGQTANGLNEDDGAMQKQLGITEEALNNLRERRSALQQEHSTLTSRADERAVCDSEYLKTARQRLQSLSEDIESNSHTLEGQIESMQELDEHIELAKHVRDTAHAATRDAQKQREDCPGWSVAEVKKIEARVEDLVASTGWRIVAANHTQLTSEMDEQLNLTFNTAAYLPAAAASPKSSVRPELTLGLSSKTSRSDATPLEPSTTQRFFLQLLRAHLHSLTPNETHMSTLLHAIASGWELNKLVEDELKCLRRRCGITTEQIAGDEKLIIETSLLVPATKSKVMISFALAAAANGEEVDAGVGVATSSAYGNEYRKNDMNKIMQKKVGEALRDVEGKKGQWADAVESLKGWLDKH